MATITGFIEKIKFRNEENGYTVMSVTDQSDGDEVIMVGTLSYAAEGDMIQATGRMTEHPVYGEQLQIEKYEMKTPRGCQRPWSAIWAPVPSKASAPLWQPGSSAILRQTPSG